MNPYLMMPCIVRETSSGYIKYQIQDEMLKQRQIECVGEITPELVSSIILQLRYLQKEDPEEEITMYINSPGGQIASGLALYDVMRAISCPVRTVCMGMAASMAALLFICGNTRDILKHGRVMIHDPLMTDGVGGSALRIEHISNDLMKMRTISGNIVAEHCNKTLDEILEVTAIDSYFDAEEAIAFGLADNIIDKI